MLVHRRVIPSIYGGGEGGDTFCFLNTFSTNNKKSGPCSYMHYSASRSKTTIFIEQLMEKLFKKKFCLAFMNQLTLLYYVI